MSASQPPAYSSAQALNHPTHPALVPANIIHCLNAASSCLFTIRSASWKANILHYRINQCYREREKSGTAWNGGQEHYIIAQLSLSKAIRCSQHQGLIQPQSMISCLLLTGLTPKKYSPLEVKSWAWEARCLHLLTWTILSYGVVLRNGIRASALHYVYQSYFLFIQVTIRTESHTGMLGFQNSILSGKLFGGTLLYQKTQTMMRL